MKPSVWVGDAFGPAIPAALTAISTKGHGANRGDRYAFHAFQFP